MYSVEDYQWLIGRRIRVPAWKSRTGPMKGTLIPGCTGKVMAVKKRKQGTSLEVDILADGSGILRTVPLSSVPIRNKGGKK